MALTLHSVSTRHLRGALALASLVGVAAARPAAPSARLRAAGRRGLGRCGAHLHRVRCSRSPGASTRPRCCARSGTARRARCWWAARRSAPPCSASTRSMLLVTASGDPATATRRCMLVVALLTTALSWSLVHLLFALEYAKLFYVDPHGARGRAAARRPGVSGRASARILGFLLFLVHHRRGLPDRRRRHLGAADAPDGAAARADRLPVQHGDPGRHHQRRRRPRLIVPANSRLTSGSAAGKHPCRQQARGRA